MQDLRTILPPITTNIKVNPNSKFLCVGSCFANHIGNKLNYGKWSVNINPFGILYHPTAIQKGIERLIDKDLFQKNDFFLHQGQWHSFYHHGSFSHPDLSFAVKQANQSLFDGTKQLKEANILMITLGTAYGFFHKKTSQFVANCHKLPNKDFDRILSDYASLTKELSFLFKKLTDYFPKLKIILTVSPVRHIRDGLIENQRSKATLVLALSELEKQFENICYFPAYELLVDDLRDYRFYKNDLIHPNDLAIEYIWEYFSNTFFNEPSKQYLKEIEKIQRAVAHRPIQPNTDAHQAFVQKTLEKMDRISNKYKHLDFRAERKKLLQ